MPEAVRAVPRGLAHEVLLEARLLVTILELDRTLLRSAGPSLQGAVDELRHEVVRVYGDYHGDQRVVGPYLSDRLVA